MHDVIKPVLSEVEGTADWILDLGPEGGVKGGEIVAEGTPEQVAAEGRSFTGSYLRPLLERGGAQLLPLGEMSAQPTEGLPSRSARGGGSLSRAGRRRPEDKPVKPKRLLPSS